MSAPVERMQTESRWDEAASLLAGAAVAGQAAVAAALA